jgi:serine/threonine protein kinase
MKTSMNNVSGSTETAWYKVAKEITAMRALQRGPHIPKLYGSYLIRAREGNISKNNLSMVTQRFEVGLDDLRTAGPLSELVVRPILKDILRAIKFIHAKGYAHRDVKISNVMLRNALGPAFLIDYGFTVRVDPGVKERTIAGTQGYLAPELFRKSLWDCRPADLFSLGCLAYNLLSRVLVFHEGGEAEVMKRNRRGRVNWEHSPLDLSRELMRLLLGLFDLDEANRLTAEEALASPWLQTPTPTSSKSTAALDVELLDGSSQGQGSLTSLKSSLRGEDRGVVTREASKELPALQCGVRTSKARPKPPDLVPLRTKRDQLDGGPGDGWGPTSPAPLSLSSPTGADYVMDFQLNKREENLLELDWGMQCESAKATTVPHIDFKMTEDDYLDGGEKLLELDLGENRGARPNRKNSRVEMAATAPEISYERSDLDVVETSRANGLRDTLQDGILEHLRSAAKAAAGKAKNSVTYFSRGFEASIRPSRSSSEAFSRLNQNSAQHSARVSPKSNHQFGFDRASLEASSPRWSKEKEVEWRSSTPFSPVAPDMSPGSPQLPTRIRRMMHRFSKEPHEENSETGGENFKHEAKTEPPQLCEESLQQVAFRPGAERKKDAYRRPNVVGT